MLKTKMLPMPSSKPRVVIYMEPDQLSFLKDWAKKERRTVNNLVSMLVDDAITKKQVEENNTK